MSQTKIAILFRFYRDPKVPRIIHNCPSAGFLKVENYNNNNLEKFTIAQEQAL